VPGRVIYHTSPDRGLHLLLQAWPAIREAVPHATLHVIGRLNEYLETAGHPSLAGSVRGQRVAAMKEGIKAAKAAGGVKFFGPLPRAAVLEELSQAACFAFPASVSAPCETFSISVLECCAIGLPVVLAPVDALESVYRDTVRLTGPAETSMPDFVDGVVNMLTDNEMAGYFATRGKLLAANFTFDAAAERLHEIIRMHHPRVVGALGSPNEKAA
jgi:glycosyltransferase involved in cell wall biosynthesis